MSGTPQTIELNAGIAGEPIIDEKKAAAATAITPGYLIEELAAGTVQEHSSAGDKAQKMFAMPNVANGGTIDDDYVVAETVRYGIFSRGQEVFALLAASAAAIVIGDSLESSGDGTLRKVVTDAATDDTERDSTVAYAIEAVDNSGGGGEVRIKVRVS